MEASSFNLALIVGPALAGTLAAVFGPEASLIVEIVLTLAALGLILLDARARPARCARAGGESVSTSRARASA